MILIILFYHDRMSCSDAHRVAFFFPSIQITCTIHQISLFSLILIHRIYGKHSVSPSFCVSLFSMIITIIT